MHIFFFLMFWTYFKSKANMKHKYLINLFSINTHSDWDGKQVIDIHKYKIMVGSEVYLKL